MSQRTSLQGLALVLAAAGLAAAGCSSSSSSSAASAASSAASSLASSAKSVISSATSAAASAVAGGTVSAADCKILKPIGANALSELTPLQSDTASQAAASISSYVTTLKAAEAKLTSPGGKQLMSGYITAVQKLPSESATAATAAMTLQYGKLVAACP
jgi:hypothetical protein